MRIAETFNYRNGRDILESPRFRTSFHEVLDVLADLPAYQSARHGNASARQAVARREANRWLETELCIKRDWDRHPLVVDAEPTNSVGKSLLRSDYRKSRIELAVHFGNTATYTSKLFRIAISLGRGQAEVGVIVVATRRFAGLAADRLAYFERVVTELVHLRPALIVPLTVIGVEPAMWTVDDYPAQPQ